MPEEIKTCQGKIWDKENYNYKPCGRPLYDDNFCICHSEVINKDMEQFQAEVQKQLDRKDYHDFSYFVFPKDYSFKDTDFVNDANFYDAKFNGEARFWSAKFGGEARFHSAEFGGEANFHSVKFKGVANFQSARFGAKTNFLDAKFGGYADFIFAKFYNEVHFSQAEFGSGADFLYAKFAREANFLITTFDREANFEYVIFIKTADFSYIRLSNNAIVKFDGENNNKDKPVFQDVTNFTNIKIPKNAEFVFRKIDLSKCEFLETDLTKVEFIDVTWAKTGGVGKWFKTYAVYDAVKKVKDNKYDYGLIAQLYRRLQINYIDNCFYSEAGHFHIGEQEAVRKGRGKIGRYFCPNMFYKIVSNYGESIIRPFLWLILILLLFPAIFLYTGIDIASPKQQEKDIKNIVNYELSFDCMLTTSDYWSAFTANLSFISFSRGQVSKRLHSQYQVLIVYMESVLVIVLISFFILALRRPFKRKI